MSQQPPLTITIELDLYAWSAHDEDAAIIEIRKLLRHHQIPSTGAIASLRELRIRKNEQAFGVYE